MPIGYVGVQHRLHGRSPVLPIPFRTRQANLALATERDHPPLLTIRTQVHRMPVGRVATPEHLLHDRVDSHIPWMSLFEGLPPVNKDLLEAVLLCPTACGHACECTQSSPLCQIIAGRPPAKRKFLWDQVKGFHGLSSSTAIPAGTRSWAAGGSSWMSRYNRSP